MAQFFKIALFVLLVSIPHVSAQHDIDSLRTIINSTHAHDTTRLSAIGLVIDGLYEDHTVVPYNELMGKIARKNLASENLHPELRKTYTMYLAAYYNNLSIQENNAGNPAALATLQKGISLYWSIGAYDEYYSGIVSKGILLSRLKRYREAIDYYFKALKYFERKPLENADGISYVYSNLGVLYGEQYQHKESIYYMKKSIEFLNKKPEKKTVEDDLQKFAMYHNIGAAYLLLNNIPDAEKNFAVALDLARKHDQVSYVAMVTGKLGLIALKRGNVDEAERKLLESKMLSDSEMSRAFAIVNLGDVYLHKREYKKAKGYLEDGLQISKAIGNTDLQEQACESLYQIGKVLGDYKMSVEMLEMFHKLRDSTKVQENRNELVRQQIRYNYEKKALNFKLKTEREAAAKNNLLVIFGALVVLLGIAGYFFYRNYRQRQALAAFEKSELSQKLMLSQMNPHFVFNSIDNIQSLIYGKRDTEALDYLSKFSKLTRQILENSSENYITLAEELHMIENYLGIQQLLYESKFDYKIEVDNEIEPETILLPPMLTQPFIENAIKHGFRGKSGKGLIEISFTMRDKRLIFEVKDNGTGFKDSIPSGSNKSLAMKITRERLRHISKKDLTIQHENIVDPQSKVTGAKVFFEIPYLYEK